jgi:hypothetical protein
LVAGVVGLPHSTCHRVLQRHGCSRRPAATREAANRYEWDCPGDLLHIDVSTYARFSRPGHAVTDDRTRTASARVADTAGCTIRNTGGGERLGRCRVAGCAEHVYCGL